MKFLRNLLASILGFSISMFLMLLFFIMITNNMDKKSKVRISPNSILKIELDKQIKDYSPNKKDSFDDLLGYNDRYLGLNTILSAIETAKKNPNIKGISIQTKRLRGGISQIKAIRKAIQSFKESGKFVMSYSDVYGQKEYYLSSVADSLFVNPFGQIKFKGLVSEVLFFKDFQDKYGIKMEVIRHGKYKSAVEPFLENKMSNSNRKQIKELLESIWEDLVAEISISRDISTKKLNFIADNLAGRNVELAIKNKLVDAAVYEDIYNEKLKNLVGDKNLSMLKFEDYIEIEKGNTFKYSENKIAVIYVQGEIVYGKGDKNNTGQDIIIKELKKVRRNKNVKAVVLRVNSPGGSALASDLIWRELELTKEKKPLVVSMGDIAASGGYYISCNANKIIAESTTITGSIGVFGMLPNASDFAEKIGVNSEIVSTNKNAYYSVLKPLDPSFYEIVKEDIDRIYTTFINKVSKGRNKDFDEINTFAQGRIWSGKLALEKGLVDELGGLDIALESAANLAGITDYKVLNYPSYKIDFKEILKKIPHINSKTMFLKKWIGNDSFDMFQKINNFINTEGIQMRLPFALDIK